MISKNGLKKWIIKKQKLISYGAVNFNIDSNGKIIIIIKRTKKN